MPTRRTHVLFDFFGTLVDYSPSRTEQGFAKSHTLLGQMGADLTYEQFLASWTATAADFDRHSDQDDSEFSMTDLGGVFLRQVLPHEPSDDEVAALVEQYLEEWDAGVRYRAGVPEFVDELAGDYQLAVVTNTHHALLVHRHLEAMGLLSTFEAIVTSVEVGWRKPHPQIYSVALATLAIGATSAVFVGDTYGPDYQGPERAGMTAYLIDPRCRAPVPEARRLSSVLDLPARLR